MRLFAEDRLPDAKDDSEHRKPKNAEQRQAHQHRVGVELVLSPWRLRMRAR